MRRSDGPPEVESEPYVRLATLRQLHQGMADVNTARSLADTLQTIADGVVDTLGYELAGVHLVQPDGDLVVAAVAGGGPSDAERSGRVTPRSTWDLRLAAGEAWGDLRFVPHTEGRDFGGHDLPGYVDDLLPRTEGAWHPGDRLFAPMHTSPASGASSGELTGVISVDRPRNGQRPGAWGREALDLYAFQASIAVGNARLRANVQRALVRLEQEQRALRASEASFRQAFEYAPSGMAVTEMGGDQHGRILRTNDALCRLLGRPASAMRRYSFSDLVHPEDVGTLLRTSAEGGRAELRLGRRDGTYIWVSLRNSVVADAADGPRFLLTHVEDIEDRRLRELQLTHQATHDTLTGLPNSAELRARLAGRLCGDPAGRAGEHHVHTAAPDSARHGGATGLAVIFCDLDGMHRVNELFGSDTGDLVLVEVGRRLANGLRHGDTVARYGGDEFVVLADGLGTDECRELTKNLRTALDAPMRINGRLVRVRASFGTAWAACGTSVKDVLHTADQRMFDDKRSRRTVDHVKEQPAVVSELRLAGPLPERPVQPWVPQRPVAQRTTVRVWQNDRTAPATPAETVVVRSGEELDRLGDTARVHHVVCRGDIADLSALHRLPVLRSLVIADNGVLPYLDELEGCRRLRFLGVTRCPSLVDWAGAARTGVMFIEVGPGHAVPPLRGLTEAGRLRRLTLREALADGDPDLVELRRCLPDVRVRVEAGAREG